MKKFALITLLVALTLGAYAQAPYSQTVSTTSQTIVADNTLKRAIAWGVGQSISVGDYREGGSENIYIAASAGTTGAGDMPVHFSGESSGVDTIVWRYVEVKKTRTAVIVTNTSATVVYLALYGTPASGAGIPLLQNQSFVISNGEYLNEISAITAAGSATVAVQEAYKGRNK